MNTWILSLVGIVFLGVMLDVIAPNGKSNNFIKSIFGLLVILTLINPIKNLITINLNDKISDDIIATNSELTLYINNAWVEQKNLKINNKLIESNIMGVNVNICGNLFEKNFVVDYVYVDISNLVLTDEITNINKYEKIEEIILEQIEIEKERIIFYE